MEQDDKVSAAALSPGSSSGAVRMSRANGARDRELDVEPDDVIAEVVASATAKHGETPDGSSDMHASELSDDAADESPPAKAGDSKTPKKTKNNVRKIRIERMMSKAELARRANLSVLTIDRVERGYGCRVDTKRKILEALGLSLADRVRVFGEEE